MLKITAKLTPAALAVTLMLAGCNGSETVTASEAESQTQVATQPEVALASTFRESAQEVGNKVANWQIAQFGHLDYIPESHREKSEDAKFWIQAAFYIGLTRWVETVGDEELLAFMKSVGERENYEVLMNRPYHADDHAIGQMYLWLTEQTGNEAAYKHLQEVFDMILANPPQVGLEMVDSEELNHTKTSKSHLEGNCQTRWCWADALFMAPRSWLMMSNVTGDPKYFDYADKEFWAAADYLFSDEYGLFFRDSRYFDMKSDNGGPVFWGRGNGWVFAAIPMIIDDLPDNHPSKPRYIELYKKNAAGLMKLQRDNGFWPASLMDPDKVKTPEISGTGFITFGLAWGVNNGILTDDHAKEVVEKGWVAIESAVEEDGRVNWVQHVGKSPDPVKKTDSQLYGAGAVLLAASEMSKWQ
ncbi:glycoside hydrolase family 88/105 protein [Alteromonas aestuariivivens]|nr:glycoside hydrolase family 88 protein [Alteromonas aestuariivivens]